MKPTILVVDDDPNITSLYEAALTARGYHVYVAGNGEEALTRAEAEHPDLVLLDVMMPEIHGLNVLDILKATPGLENCKVIMLTALDDPATREKAMQTGAVDYIVKSETNMADVIQRAERVL